MAVVAAGVHGTVHDRAVGWVALLLQRQGVHVGAGQHRPAGASPLEQRHHPGSADAAAEIEAEFS